eukprot:879324_1
MANARPHGYRVPRNFKLLDELEKGERGIQEGRHTGYVSYGLDELEKGERGIQEGRHTGYVSYGLDGDDMMLSTWNGTIIGPQNTNLGERIFTLRIICNARYPIEAPAVRFVQRINMPCIRNDGTLDYRNLQNFHWDDEKSISEVLCALRDAMEQVVQLPQPPDGSLY